ncbi:MAG: hypothetical protein RRA35_03100 [Desulfomonilia bacterium]|nr:hypothetical protein [Desulfomonilia bacterium]
MAFQKYVLERACPGHSVNAFLMMADKNALCPTDGLNQKFRIVRDMTNRKGVRVSTTLTEEDLVTRILVEVPVDDPVRLIHRQTYTVGGLGMSFAGLVDFLASHYDKDLKIPPEIGAKCSRCEFRCTPEQEVQGAPGGIRCLNFADWPWIRFGADGRVVDPYDLLPPVFDAHDDAAAELMSTEEELKEGGAAMTAYCRLQFSEMGDYERDKLEAALLKYCELDTLAMVMIYEAWRESGNI